MKIAVSNILLMPGILSIGNISHNISESGIGSGADMKRGTSTVSLKLNPQPFH